MTTPQAVYIKDRNSGMVLEYKPDTAYEVVIEPQSSGKKSQQWFVTDSGVAGYIYIQSMLDNKVISAGEKAQDPLYLATKNKGVDTSQLWILRAPNDGTNAYSVIMSVKTGYVMDVPGASKSEGTRVNASSRNNGHNQQFSFY